MKRILLSVLAVVFLLPPLAFAEIQTVTKTIRQPFGGSQSADDARIAAVARAKREALEQAGTYVESLTVVKESRLDKDEILAVTAGVCQSEVLASKNYHTDDAFGIEVTVKVKADTAVLGDKVKKLLADRTHLEQLNSVRKNEKELLAKIAKLETENRNLKATEEEKQRIKEGFRQTSQGLTAVKWFDKAAALWKDGKFSDPHTAIRYLDEAIKLEPDSANTFNNRGVAYADLGQYARAIEDYSQAIRLKPDDAKAYNNRGIAYYNLGHHARAIEDYNQAIRLKPDYAGAFNNRGNAYLALGQYARAIEDYNQAIRLKPDYTEAFSNRGAAYDGLRQYARAIEDFNQAIRLKPDYTEAYNNRGIAYAKLGQYVKAIEDFSQAIRLKPDYAIAFSNRGRAHLQLGHPPQGCRDASTACNLGDCKLLEITKREGWCNARQPHLRM